MKNAHFYIASCDPEGGIYHYRRSEDELILEETLPLRNPMYLALSEDRLYCVLLDPFENSQESGVVEIRLNGGFFGDCSAPVGTHGRVGCHLCLLDEKIYVANYTSGNLCRLPDRTAQHSGHSVNPQRQEGPHTHCIIPTPDGRYLCATDLGTDEIVVYDRELKPVSRVASPLGAGPRHLVFSEDGTRLYCVNELQSGVTVYSYTEGVLRREKTHSSLPEGYGEESLGAAIRLHEGKIYVSNRGHDSIAWFEEKGGELEKPEFVPTGGSYPRDFFIMDDLLLCANERSDCVTVFRMEEGRPIPADQVLKMKSPLAIVGEHF